MNLLQVRQLFRKLSGRFDLVNRDGSDNGANFFINEGRKYLDRLDETQKSWANCYRLLKIGSFSISIPHCRAIKEVWLATVSGGRWQLEKVNLQDLIEGYLTGLPSSRTGGNPYYYSPCISRYIPENATVQDMDLGAFTGFVDVPAGNAHFYNSILLSNPVSEKSMVTVTGLFHSMELVNDTDKNYWSEAHPLLLVMAAMRYTEVVNRNTQGVNDWTASIKADMEQLGFDLVEELIAEVSEMGD